MASLSIKETHTTDLTRLCNDDDDEKKRPKWFVCIYQDLRLFKRVEKKNEHRNSHE